MSLVDNITMYLILLIIFGIPVIFLLWTRKNEKSQVEDLPDEIKEQLIHAERQKVSNQEKKMLRQQTNSGKLFLVLSVLILAVVLIIWYQVRMVIGCLITYAVLELAVFLVVFQNERHLFFWCRNYKTKGYMLRTFLVRGGVGYEIAYYNCKKKKIVLQYLSMNFADRKDKLGLEGKVTDVVIHKNGIRETIVAIPFF